MKGPILLLAILSLAVPASIAQTKPDVPAPTPKAEAPKGPPVIPLDLKYRLIKSKGIAAEAQVALERAQQQAQVTNQEFRSIVDEAQKACGADYDVSLDRGGDPVCTPKPKPAAPTPPPAAKK